MAKLALWAINGIGSGHTVRISRLAVELRLRGLEIKFIFEHESQRTLLESGYADVPILLVPRPWKVTGTLRNSSKKAIKEFLKDVDGLVLDVGSVTSQHNLQPLLPNNVSPIFLLRWMTSDRWQPVAANLLDYKSAIGIFVMPQQFFMEMTGLGEPDFCSFRERIYFINGFIYNPTLDYKEQRNNSRLRVCFCCGAGGIHSGRGYIELQEVIQGFYIVREKLSPRIKMDAWVGHNEDLRKLATEVGVFDRVVGFNENTTPHWDDYKVIVGRCGYNTFIEVMKSSALFVTSVFESDGEHNELHFKNLTKYGLQLINIDKNDYAKAIIGAVAHFPENRRSVIPYRRGTFTNGLSNLAELILQRVKKEL